MPENANTGPGPDDKSSLRAILEDREKAQLLDWLCTKMMGTNLHMDGTMDWSFTHKTTSGIRAKSALEAIKQAKERSP